MKPTKSITLLSMMIATMLLQSSCSSVVKLKKGKDNYVEIKDILESVQFALKSAYEMNAERYTGDENALSFLESVDLEFGNSIATKFGGEVSFWVIKAGASRNKENATTFTYGFKPLTGRDDPFVGDEEKKKLLAKRSAGLIAALNDLGTCLHKYEDPNFRLTSIDLELEVTITNSKEAGVEFNIGVVGVNPSGSLETANSNKMTLSLKFPERFTPDELESNKETVRSCIKIVDKLENVDESNKKLSKEILERLIQRATVKKGEWSDAIEEAVLMLHGKNLLDDYMLELIRRKLEA